MKKEILDVLSKAVSEVGSWQGWNLAEDLVQLEFCDAMLYDETKPEKESHTSTVALRFRGRAFAVFLDNLEEKNFKKWYDRFRDDEIRTIAIDPSGLAFDDHEFAHAVYGSYSHKTWVKRSSSTKGAPPVKYILAAKCEDVGFVVGGDELAVVGNKGEYGEEEIEKAARQWWDYWRKYWTVRGTEEAYRKDWACEVTIPANAGQLVEQWLAEQE